jgi:hypothetical protein
VNPGDVSLGADPELPAVSLEHLAQARRWARLVATFGFVCAAFFLLATAGMAAVPSTAKFPKGVFVASFVVAIAVVSVFAGLLWGYSGALRSFAIGRPSALVVAFRRLRIFWMLLAIGYVFSLLAGVVFVAMAISGVIPTP